MKIPKVKTVKFRTIFPYNRMEELTELLTDMYQDAEEKLSYTVSIPNISPFYSGNTPMLNVSFGQNGNWEAAIPWRDVEKMILRSSAEEKKRWMKRFRKFSNELQKEIE